jgi:hypothetical protein
MYKCGETSNIYLFLEIYDQHRSVDIASCICFFKEEYKKTRFMFWLPFCFYCGENDIFFSCRCSCVVYLCFHGQTGHFMSSSLISIFKNNVRLFCRVFLRIYVCTSKLRNQLLCSVLFSESLSLERFFKYVFVLHGNCLEPFFVHIII